MFWLLLLLLPAATGFLTLCCLWPFPESWKSNFGLKCALGLPLGFGFSSLVYFGALVIGGAPSRGLLLSLDAVLLLTATAIFYFVFHPKPPAASGAGAAGLPQTFKVLRVVLVAGVLLGLIIQIYTAVQAGQNMPYGHWDAWASWNLRAEFLYKDGEHWKDYVSHAEWIEGSQYPLLLTSLVVRGWTYVGGDTVLVPGLLGYLFAFTELAIVFFSIRLLKSATQGHLAGLFFLASPRVLHWGASQYADTPAGCYLLAMLATLALHDAAAERKAGMLCLAGLFGGFALWTKYEGAVFIIAVFIARWMVVSFTAGFKAYLRQALWLGAGMLPGILAFIILRFYSKTPEYLAVQSLSQMLSNLFDPLRANQVFWKFMTVFSRGASIAFGIWPATLVSLLIYAPLMGVKQKSRDALRTVLCLWIVVLLTICGYFAIFMMTPMDLAVHLDTTAYRFFWQVYPCIFLAYFLTVVAPEDALREAGLH